MQQKQPLASLLALAAASASACTIPAGPALSNNITGGFSLLLQNASYPDIHNHFLNIWDWGGGDQHLFVSPAGNYTSELQLIDGVITLPWDPPRRAVINGEVRKFFIFSPFSAFTHTTFIVAAHWQTPPPSSPSHPAISDYEPLDNTTKMFMTERGDPRAVWDVVYGCDPDTDALQVELAFKERADTPAVFGGLMGVRPFNGNYDFRWKGPGTSVNDPDRPWVHVTLVVIPTDTD
ncbi:hypothetical protein GGS24DRAFT_499496 [Hypoxylon argillaceum]|nr:hypothetical protein GGS24DRAFT_499496 [Hypoxylon argillaceum]